MRKKAARAVSGLRTKSSWRGGGPGESEPESETAGGDQESTLKVIGFFISDHVWSLGEIVNLVG